MAAHLGTAGTTPSALADIAAVRKLMNKNGVPTDGRCALWDTDADAALVQIPAIVSAERSGSPRPCAAAPWRIMGLDNYMSQAVKTHAGGAVTGTPKVNGAVAAGASAIPVNGTSAGSTVKKGDLLTVDGAQYVCTEDVSLGTGGSVKVYPAVAAAIESGAAVSFVQSGVQNLAFHPMAFAFVCRPRASPPGGELHHQLRRRVPARVPRLRHEVQARDPVHGRALRLQDRVSGAGRAVPGMTVYADYGFYSGTYGGSLTAAEYAAVCVPASALVDAWTGSRAAAAQGETLERVRYAACAAADALHGERGGRLVSAANAGYSETYAAASRSPGRRLNDAAAVYLMDTGLMAAWVL